MSEKPQVNVSRSIVVPLVSRLLNAENENELAQAGMKLQNFVLQGEPREAIYVFAYESWTGVESFLRVGETRFKIKEFDEFPPEMQSAIAALGFIWGKAFQKFPYEMSRAFVEIFEKSDSAARMRLTWFSLPISKYLGRDVMSIAKEQLASKKKGITTESPLGLKFLAIWLVLMGLLYFIRIPSAYVVVSLLALVAGVLIVLRK